MDHMKVLKRAFDITWRYRALWLFGVLVALTTTRGGNGGQVTYRGEGNFPTLGREIHIPEIPPQLMGTLIAVGAGLACLFVLLSLVALVLRYVGVTALIRMVDDHEETGEKRRVGWGFRRGWLRAAWRLFLIDLLIGLPAALIFVALLLLALSPLLLWTTGDKTAGILGTVAAIGMFLPLILLAVVVSAVLSLLIRFFRRACVLESLGVIEAIRQGYGLVRGHLKDVGVMWLIMIGLGIAWALLMVPVMIALVLLGLFVGGLPALLIGGLTSLVLEGAAPWILGAVIGVSIFILVIAVPGLFLGGLAEVFRSSVWTLTYRELRSGAGSG